MDRASSQFGTPNGSLTIMAMGEVKGMMLSQNDKLLSGLFTMKLNDMI